MSGTKRAKAAPTRYADQAMRRLLLLTLSVIAGCSFKVAGLSDNAALDDAAVDAYDASLADSVSVDVASETVSPKDGAIDSTTDTEPPFDARDAAYDSEKDDRGVDADADAIVDAPRPFCDKADPDLVGCYRFEPDESPDQPHDDSKYGNNGTSAEIGYVTGVDGKAMSFGGSAYTHVPDSPSLDVSSALTLETWVKVHSMPTPIRAGLFDDDGQYGLFVLASGAIRCSTAPAIADTLPSTVVLDTWMHVACVYNGASMIVYVNGVKSVEVAGTGSIVTSSSAGCAIGMNSPSGDVLDGAMDDLRIFRVARTASQICKDAGKC